MRYLFWLMRGISMHASPTLMNLNSLSLVKMVLRLSYHGEVISWVEPG